MVEAVAANGANQMLDEGILPRGVLGGPDLVDAKPADAIAEGPPVDAIAVAQDVPRPYLEMPRQSAGRPIRRWLPRSTQCFDNVINLFYDFAPVTVTAIDAGARVVRRGMPLGIGE